MGLIKAGIGALGGAMADQWKEFFYCDALDSEILMRKGQKRTSGRSSNTKGEDNIISNGSGIAVADGQCMIIVEQGKIVEICAESGEFTYDTSTEPSIFTGSLGESVKRTFQTIGKRFTYGGDTGKDQRVYYFNTKEILDNKFGTREPVPFRVVDQNIGLDIDISIRCNGVFSYRLANPVVFYTNVCGNVAEEYRRDTLDTMLKPELLTHLGPAFAKISAAGIRYSALPGHNVEIRDALKSELTEEWFNQRGIEVVNVAINSATASQEDEDMIKQLQRTAVMRDPTMAAATITGAQSDAMRAAAANENGAMMGFMGLGMAQQAGGTKAQDLFEMGQKQTAQRPTAAGQPAPDGWVCSCGTQNTGKFCMNCGSARPVETSWTCSCGAQNKGKFCSECGKPRPAETASYKCSRCGWVPEDPAHPPKFCPECGDPFDTGDRA